MIVPEVFLSVMVFCRYLRLLQNAVFSKDDQEFFYYPNLKTLSDRLENIPGCAQTCPIACKYVSYC